jgi:hypothetical protein
LGDSWAVPAGTDNTIPTATAVEERKRSNLNFMMGVV